MTQHKQKHKQTMQRISRDYWESPERLDGEPDIRLYREGRDWIVSYRTSAMVSRFTTLKNALAYIED